jgi:adenylate cyclase
LRCWRSPMSAIDFEAEGLLEDLEGRERAARIELLEDLVADGTPLEELKRAVAEDRLALLPVERVLAGDGPRYTAAEVAERAGLEPDFPLRQRQALGLSVPDPEAAEFTDDLEAAKRAKALRDAGLPEEGMLEVSRIIGRAMSQVAAANRELIAETILQPGDTERDVSLRLAQAAEQLLPMLGPVLQYVLNLHQREVARNDVIGRAELASGQFANTTEITVCFADLVGFTRLGEELSVEDLRVVTDRFSELASEVAVAPVRLVKLIGDAAMLVAPETDPVLDAALGLIDRVEAESESFPLVHAGVARGHALPRAGDWYGRPVNLASRITGVAYPSSVLASSDVKKSARGEYRWSDAGRRRFKGVSGGVQLYRVRAPSG